MTIADDGSVDVYIGPEAPPSQEHDSIRTLPELGWFPPLRIYWAAGAVDRRELETRRLEPSD